jgi:hypothetical protein
MNNYGARNVLLPYGYLQYFSYVKNFNAYDLVLSPGEHFILSYGKSWKNKTALCFTGVMTNDISYRNNNLNSKNFNNLIKKIKSKGYKIISVFPGSVVHNSNMSDRIYETVKLVAQILDRNKKIFVVIKPKAFYRNEFEKERYVNLLEKYIIGERLYIIDGKDEINSSVQYLALESDLCISVSGYCQNVSTSWIESALLGTPSLAFDPGGTSVKTPMLDQFYGKLIFDNSSEMLKEVEKVIIDGIYSERCVEQLKLYFDRYCDNSAIKRIRKYLKDYLSNEKEFIMNNITIKEMLNSEIRR